MRSTSHQEPSQDASFIENIPVDVTARSHLPSQAIGVINKSACNARQDTLGHTVLAVPGVGAAAAGEGVAVAVVGVVVRAAGEQHVGVVVGVVFGAADAVDFLGAVAHGVEGVGLGLAVAVVDAGQAVEGVVAVGFGADEAGVVADARWLGGCRHRRRCSRF